MTIAIQDTPLLVLGNVPTNSRTLLVKVNRRYRNDKLPILLRGESAYSLSFILKEDHSYTEVLVREDFKNKILQRLDEIDSSVFLYTEALFTVGLLNSDNLGIDWSSAVKYIDQL